MLRKVLAGSAAPEEGKAAWDIARSNLQQRHLAPMAQQQRATSPSWLPTLSEVEAPARSRHRRRLPVAGTVRQPRPRGVAPLPIMRSSMAATLRHVPHEQLMNGPRLRAPRSTPPPPPPTPPACTSAFMPCGCALSSTARFSGACADDECAVLLRCIKLSSPAMLHSCMHDIQVHIPVIGMAWQASQVLRGMSMSFVATLYARPGQSV